MSIDRLAPAANLLAALRGEMTRQSERTGTVVRRNDVEGAQEGGRKPGHDKNRLRADIREIVRNAPLSDEEAVRGARRRIVRAMLLWEFGTGLREHPEWQPMLESITRTLEASPRHRAAFDAVMKQFGRP